MTTSEIEAPVATPEPPAEPPKPWLIRRGLLPATGPQQLIAVASFINMLGSGVFMVSAALFFTRSVGLSIAQVGLAMGAASVLGLFAGLPVGHLADRRGPREVYLVTLCVQGAAALLLVFVHSFWLLAVSLCVSELARSASTAARAPIVRSFGGANLTSFRSYLRSVANLATSAGAIGAGLAIQLDSRSAYLALIIGNAVSFVASAAVVAFLPTLPPVPAPRKARRWGVLTDHAYTAVILLDGLMSMQYKVLMFALPLWIVGFTDAPRWMVGAAALVNTALVVVLQVRASRGVDSSKQGANAMRRAGFAFLVGMVLMAYASGMPTWIALVMVGVGICVHTLGELWHAAGSLELRFRLAPAHAQGQYSGMYGLGSGLVNVFTPTLLGFLCITWGKPGWLVLAGLFVAIGLAMPAVVRWADRTRPEEAPA